jgi:hypothetical protein
MSEPAVTIDIDRLILTDLDVTPDRAERIRAWVESALQRLLEGDGWPDAFADNAVSYVNLPTIHLDELHSDRDLANRLARSIAETLRGMREQEEGA